MPPVGCSHVLLCWVLIIFISFYWSKFTSLRLSYLYLVIERVLWSHSPFLDSLLKKTGVQSCAAVFASLAVGAASESRGSNCIGAAVVLVVVFDNICAFLRGIPAHWIVHISFQCWGNPDDYVLSMLFQWQLRLLLFMWQNRRDTARRVNTVNSVLRFGQFFGNKTASIQQWIRYEKLDMAAIVDTFCKTFCKLYSLLWTGNCLERLMYNNWFNNIWD